MHLRSRSHPPCLHVAWFDAWRTKMAHTLLGGMKRRFRSMQATRSQERSLVGIARSGGTKLACRRMFVHSIRQALCGRIPYGWRVVVTEIRVLQLCRVHAILPFFHASSVWIYVFSSSPFRPRVAIYLPSLVDGGLGSFLPRRWFRTAYGWHEGWAVSLHRLLWTGWGMDKVGCTDAPTTHLFFPSRSTQRRLGRGLEPSVERGARHGHLRHPSADHPWRMGNATGQDQPRQEHPQGEGRIAKPEGRRGCTRTRPRARQRSKRSGTK